MRRLALDLVLISGLAMTVRGAGSVSYVVLNNGGTNGLVRVFPDGSVNTIAANVYGYAVAEEPNGNLGVVNAGNPALQIVTPQGAVSNLVPVLNHYDLGFESFVDANDGNTGAYPYDFASTHWFYTNSGLFPYLHDFTLNHWLSYFPDSKNVGHYTANPRYFTNLRTGKIFTM